MVTLGRTGCRARMLLVPWAITARPGFASSVDRVAGGERVIGIIDPDGVYLAAGLHTSTMHRGRPGMRRSYSDARQKQAAPRGICPGTSGV